MHGVSYICDYIHLVKLSFSEGENLLLKLPGIPEMKHKTQIPRKNNNNK
jgi:hypothetical protein